MSNVVELSKLLAEFQDEGAVTPREAKRFAGFLILECAVGVYQDANLSGRYHFMERVLSGTSRFAFQPNQACVDLANELAALVSGGYVNLNVARRMAGHLVLSVADANRQSYEVVRRDRKLCTDHRLVRFISMLGRESEPDLRVA